MIETEITINEHGETCCPLDVKLTLQFISYERVLQHWEDDSLSYVLNMLIQREDSIEQRLANKVIRVESAVQLLEVGCCVGPWSCC